MNNLTKYLKLSALLFSLYVIISISACSDDDPPLPDNLAAFESATIGMGDDVDEVEIKIALTRAVDLATDITVNFTPNGLTYGDHFTTLPAASSNSLTITVPAGSNISSFTVLRSEGVFLEGSETVTFLINRVDEPVLIGSTSQTVLSFSSIVSEGSQLTLNGLIGAEPGTSAGNAVFVDLSNNQQTSIARTGWDIGFYNGDDFRVIINNVSGASVIMVNETDLASVTSSDIDPDDLAVGFGAGTLDIIDDPDGDISNTAIDAISATPDENKVYVINRVGGSGAIGDVEDLVKVRIIRKGDGYTLQHAKINERTFASVDIDKSDLNNFEYFNFTTGKVSVEPAKDKWDLQWTWSIYKTESPAGSGNFLPYGFSDLVFINHLNGTQAAEVLTSVVSYNDFQESNLSAITFADGRNTIGPDWRVTSPPASAGVNTDRFYVIKDPVGNIYKLKFISFHPNDGGTRGKPVIEYALVKKAE